MQTRKGTWMVLAAGVLMVLAIVALAQAPHFDRSRSMSKPPAGRSAVEKKVLAVLDRMASRGETFLDVGADGGRVLRLLAENMDAKNVVEIGTSTGYSGLWISLALSSTGGHLSTFEIDPGRAAQARAHFQEAGVEHLVTVVQGDAHQNVKTVKGPIDLLFIDADKEGYPDYLAKLLPLVRPGGVLVADNAGMAPEYIAIVTRNPDLDTVFFDDMSITLKKR